MGASRTTRRGSTKGNVSSLSAYAATVSALADPSGIPAALTGRIRVSTDPASGHWLVVTGDAGAVDPFTELPPVLSARDLGRGRAVVTLQPADFSDTVGRALAHLQGALAQDINAAPPAVLPSSWAALPAAVWSQRTPANPAFALLWERARLARLIRRAELAVAPDRRAAHCPDGPLRVADADQNVVRTVLDLLLGTVRASGAGVDRLAAHAAHTAAALGAWYDVNRPEQDDDSGRWRWLIGPAHQVLTYNCVRLGLAPLDRI